jgi:hypothetical protein
MPSSTVPTTSIPVTQTVALTDQASTDLSDLQKDFERYSQGIELTQAQLASLKSLAQIHHRKRDVVLGKIEDQSFLLKRQTVLFLDERLMTKRGLSIALRQMAARIICELGAELLDTAQGEDMPAVIDRHQAQVDDDLDADAQALFDKISQQLEEAIEQRFAAQAARQSANNKRKKNNKSSKQPSTEQQAHAASAKELIGSQTQTLKSIYRQLSSVLHPDREPDAALRERKNGLMVEANIAYADQDLFALLRLQLMAQSYGGSGAQLAREQQEQVNSMLRQQLTELKSEVQDVTSAMRRAFGLNYGAAVTGQTLARALKQDAEALLSQLKYMTYELAQMQADDQFLKQWLREMD